MRLERYNDVVIAGDRRERGNLVIIRVGLPRRYASRNDNLSEEIASTFQVSR